MKKTIIFMFLLLSLFLTFKIDVKADEDDNTIKEETCSKDSNKKAYIYNGKEYCYGEGEKVYCSKTSSSISGCFIIDKNSKKEYTDAGTLSYDIKWESDTPNTKLVTTISDSVNNDKDLWWSSVYGCKKGKNKFSINEVLGIIGILTDNLLLIGPSSINFLKSNEYFAYTDSLSTQLRSKGTNSFFSIYYQDCDTFEVKNVDKLNQVSSCTSVGLRENDIYAYAEEYKENKSAVLISGYKIKLDEIRLLCSQAVQKASYNDACVNRCLNINQDIDEWNKAFGTSVGKKTCGFSEKIIAWILNIIKWIKYIIPVVVIILGILDFIKATGSDKDDDMKKAQGNFVKRLIAAALIFLIPLIIQFILPILGFDYYSCSLF